MCTFCFVLKIVRVILFWVVVTFNCSATVLDDGGGAGGYDDNYMMIIMDDSIQCLFINLLPPWVSITNPSTTEQTLQEHWWHGNMSHLA